MTIDYDAVFIGGGPAGATLGLLLARAGWSVLLIERLVFPRRKVCGEYLSATNLQLLEHLGVADALQACAGPPVRRVGLFAGSTRLHADLPRMSANRGWGWALGREQLDTLLLDQAARAGVDVRQGWTVQSLVRPSVLHEGTAAARTSGAQVSFRTPILVAAHGSWEPGSLPTQPVKSAPRPSDLLGFKAHLRSSSLPEDLMPLLCFPGGYGGMVHTSDGRISLSCCIRRDTLEKLRGQTGTTAGELVAAHVSEHCGGVREALDGALRDGPWLAAGPIRPGIRLRHPPGIFAVGNAAGEAHPVIAEGISMAMQSSWLLAELLQAWRAAGSVTSRLDEVSRAYARAWKRAFVPRLTASSLIAQWAMRPAAVRPGLPLLRCFPSLLTWGARASGKVCPVVTQRAATPQRQGSPTS